MRKNLSNGRLRLLFVFIICSNLFSTVWACDPAVVTASGATTFCQGGSVTLSTTATGVTYQWYKNGVSISGAVNSGYSATESGSYTLQTDESGCTATSNSISVTVNQYPVNQIPVGPHTFCSSAQYLGIYYNTTPASARLTSFPSGVTAVGFMNGSPSGVMQQLSFAPVATITTYNVVGETYLNGCTTTVNVEVVVKPTPTISTTTPASRCGTGTVTLGATASAGVVNWYNQLLGAKSGSLLGTGNTFTTPSISVTKNYYAAASLDGCEAWYCTEVKATVATPPTTAQYPTVIDCGPFVSITGNTPTVGTGTWAITTAPSVTAYFTNNTNPSTKLYIATPFKSATVSWTISNPPCASSSISRSVMYTVGGCNSAKMGWMEESEENTFTGGTNIIPNPSTDNFNITINSAENKEVEIVISDMNGELVKKDKITTNKQYQFGDELTAGMYVVKVVDGADIKTYKVVKTE